MKASELREMSDEQLTATLEDSLRTLFKLSIRAQTERLDAPSELRKQRLIIARIKTIETERHSAAVSDAPSPSVENTKETKA